MQAANNNVTMLNHGNTVYKHILSFIRSSDSENTVRDHEDDIRLFFKLVKNKEIEELELIDLKIILADVLDYRTFLAKDYVTPKGVKYKNTTIIRKINSVRSLYNYLKANEYEVNKDIFKEALKGFRNDVHHIGYLSPDETWILADFALTEKHDALEKRALILLAASTSIRKTAILNMKYSDIMQSNDDKDMYTISNPELFDKGEQVDKEFHETLYKLLMQIKEQNQHKDSDKIFTLSNMAISQMMKRLCAKAGIDPRRNCSFHSLKKSGVKLVMDVTGDLHAAQMQAGHSSPETTSKYYLEKKKNIAGRAFFQQIDAEIFDELSREELLKLVKGIGNGLGLQLRTEAKKIVDSRG